MSVDSGVEKRSGWSLTSVQNSKNTQLYANLNGKKPRGSQSVWRQAVTSVTSDTYWNLCRI